MTTSGQQVHVLIIEDSADDAELAGRALHSLGRPVHLHRIESADGLYEALGERRWDVVLCDHGLPSFSTWEALEIAAPVLNDAPFIVLSGTIGAASVFKAVYIEKRDLKCACVGGSSNVPLGFVSLTENLMMIAMAVWMILVSLGMVAVAAHAPAAAL